MTHDELLKLRLIPSMPIQDEDVALLALHDPNDDEKFVVAAIISGPYQAIVGSASAMYHAIAQQSIMLQAILNRFDAIGIPENDGSRVMIQKMQNHAMLVMNVAQNGVHDVSEKLKKGQQ